MSEHSADPMEKRRSVRVSRRGFAVGAAATLAARRGREALARESTPIGLEDETLDAGGATLRVASWGGFWQEIERRYLLDQFQTEFSCTVQYTSAWAWFPGFVARGIDNPPFDLATCNQPELNRATKADAAEGGFFVPLTIFGLV
jgi:putative spermidine/putrescine transport system substrate-binding protein